MTQVGTSGTSGTGRSGSPELRGTIGTRTRGSSDSVEQVEQGQGVCPDEPLHLTQCGTTRSWKISRYSNSKVFRHGPFWSSRERTFWSSWGIAAVRYPWHGWSAVEDCPRPEAGSAPNVRQYYSGACMCWSQICMKRAKIQCMFKVPFLWATIYSPSEVDLWRRRERYMLWRCFTLELNRIPLPGSIIHKMWRYALFTETTLRSKNLSFVSEQRWP